MNTTVTLHDCAELFRSVNIPISETVLGSMIIAEKFPFAVGIKENQRGVYLIFTKGVCDYLEEKTGRRPNV